MKQVGYPLKRIKVEPLEAPQPLRRPEPEHRGALQSANPKPCRVPRAGAAKMDAT